MPPIPGKWGKPTDIAAAVAFLASDEARMINGAALVVDFGVLA
jgi:NAD(P)-dependent dehydrogenase (short-subunit alcohol dehydrogenase family)